jgi:hypothetical protein
MAAAVTMTGGPAGGWGLGVHILIMCIYIYIIILLIINYMYTLSLFIIMCTHAYMCMHASAFVHVQCTPSVIHALECDSQLEFYLFSIYIYI